MKKKYRKTGSMALLLILLWGLLSLTGCKKETDNLEKVKDLAFTVTAEENIPEELLKTLQEKQTDGFKVTYQDNGFMYLCRGYGNRRPVVTVSWWSLCMRQPMPFILIQH